MRDWSGIDSFTDKGWHPVAEIAEACGQDEKLTDATLSARKGRSTGGLYYESRTIPKTRDTPKHKEWRVIKKANQQIDYAVLQTKIQPILERMEKHIQRGAAYLVAATLWDGLQDIRKALDELVN